MPGWVYDSLEADYYDEYCGEEDYYGEDMDDSDEGEGEEDEDEDDEEGSVKLELEDGRIFVSIYID